MGLYNTFRAYILHRLSSCTDTNVNTFLIRNVHAMKNTVTSVTWADIFEMARDGGLTVIGCQAGISVSAVIESRPWGFLWDIPGIVSMWWLSMDNGGKLLFFNGLSRINRRHWRRCLLAAHPPPPSLVTDNTFHLPLWDNHWMFTGWASCSVSPLLPCDPYHNSAIDLILYRDITALLDQCFDVYLQS